jgi:hypothetical protein
VKNNISKTIGLWIDTEILFDEKLNSSEKILLAQIIALHNAKGCFANNLYFSKLLNISKDRAGKLINRLIKNKYLISEIDKSSGNHRILIPQAKTNIVSVNTTIPRVENNDTLSSETTIPIVENEQYKYNLNKNLKNNKNGYIKKNSKNKYGIEKQMDFTKGF